MNQQTNIKADNNYIKLAKIKEDNNNFIRLKKRKKVKFPTNSKLYIIH